MKTSLHPSLWLAGFLSIASTFVSLAQTAVPPAPPAPVAGPVVPPTKPEELAAREKVMAGFDLSKNGQLEPAEREAYLKHLEDEKKKFIQQFDTNGDGLLDEAERNAARSFFVRKKFEQKAAARAAAPLSTKPSPAPAPAK